MAEEAGMVPHATTASLVLSSHIDGIRGRALGVAHGLGERVADYAPVDPHNL